MMYYLAGVTARQGKKTIVTTTTHILQPVDGSYAKTETEYQSLWEEHRYAVIGKCTSEGKLKSPDDGLLNLACAQADIVFIEADGAKHFPLKVPKETEPVIIPQSDIVIGVVGLDSIGNTLETVCFRKDQAVSLLQTKEKHIITEEDIVKILSSEKGTKKYITKQEYYVVLNKCDDDERLESAGKIAKLLERQGILKVAATRFEKQNGQERNSYGRIYTYKSKR